MKTISSADRHEKKDALPLGLAMTYSMLPSIRPLKTKTQFLRRPFQFSVNEVFRIKAEKMKVWASFPFAKQLQKAAIRSGE